MGLNYAAEGVRNYTLYFPPASQVWAHALPVRAPARSTISNPAEPHGNRNRGGDRDLGMLHKGGVVVRSESLALPQAWFSAGARRASGPGARGVGVRYGNGLFSTHKSPNFIYLSFTILVISTILEYPDKVP